MNEELQKALAGIIGKVTSGADAAVQFGKEQLPDVLRQLLVWNFTVNFVIWLFAFATIAGYLVFMLTRFARWQRENKNYSSEQDTMYFVVTCIWTSASFIAIFILLDRSDWLKIWLAPKLYLLEYAASVLKSAK